MDTHISSKKQVLIIGATSEVALELCKLVVRNDREVILAGRNITRLKPFQANIFLQTNIKPELIECDVQNEEDRKHINSISEKVDVLCVFVGYLGDQEKPIENLKETQKIIDINFKRLTEIIATYANDFSIRGEGMIVGLSSVAGERGRASNFVYGSAKAALSVYLDGLRGYLYDKGVHVLKVVPGFMDTKMLNEKRTPLFLTASPKKAAKIIYDAINKRKNTVYVDWKWYWIMRIIKKIPESIFKKLNL